MRNVHPQDSAHHDLNAPKISQEAAREMLAECRLMLDYMERRALESAQFAVDLGTRNATHRLRAIIAKAEGRE